MTSIPREPLDLPGAGKLRYTPLPALSLADYVEDYVGQLWHSGVFDHLSTAGAGLNIADVRSLDLSAIGVIGAAVGKLLTGDGGAKPKRLSEIALDHARRFGVQVKDEVADDWVDLGSVDAFNKHIPPDLLLDFVRALGGSALRPLLSRLFSSDGEKPDESPKPSPENTTES